jgi:hypothetical protein
LLCVDGVLKMMKRILLGACAVVIMAGFATAQTATTNPPPPPPQDQQQVGPDANGQNGWGDWWSGKRRGHHGGNHMRGGADGGPNGGPGMRMPGKGFNIELSAGRSLHINCGDEPMKECIASAQPLIDALNKAPAQ